MRTNKTINCLVTASAILGGLAYLAFRDNSTYGRKNEFPKSFYGRAMTLEQVSNDLKKMYLEGHLSEDCINNILDGKITQIERINIKPEEEEILKKKGYLIK